MNKVLVALLVSALGTSSALAQSSATGSNSNASEPTREAGGTYGPQDSIGKSGESPTKDLIQKSNNGNSRETKGQSSSGKSGNRSATAASEDDSASSSKAQGTARRTDKDEKSGLGNTNR